MDSNHGTQREQIYSLPRLASSLTAHMCGDASPQYISNLTCITNFWQPLLTSLGHRLSRDTSHCKYQTNCRRKVTTPLKYLGLLHIYKLANNGIYNKCISFMLFKLFTTQEYLVISLMAPPTGLEPVTWRLTAARSTY